jgi:hypothetical protein
MAYIRGGGGQYGKSTMTEADRRDWKRKLFEDGNVIELEVKHRSIIEAFNKTESQVVKLKENFYFPLDWIILNPVCEAQGVGLNSIDHDQNRATTNFNSYKFQMKIPTDADNPNKWQGFYVAEKQLWLNTVYNKGTKKR